MSETTKPDLDFGKAFEEAFPNYTCMRCGNDSFVLVSSLGRSLRELSEKGLRSNDKNILHYFSSVPTVEGLSREIWERMFLEVSCKRCGFTERYFAPMLMTAEKPIVPGDR